MLANDRSQPVYSVLKKGRRAARRFGALIATRGDAIAFLVRALLQEEAQVCSASGNMTAMAAAMAAAMTAAI